MFWDNVAWVYDIFVNVINRRTHQQLKQIIAELMEPDDNVLECACGTGMLTEVMAQKCMHVIATDYAEKMLKLAEKNCRAYSNITFEPADITALPYPNNTFDKVAAGNVIHLLDEPLKALRELNRVCRSGGMLIIPTYMNKAESGADSGFSKAVGKAGADFKRQFTSRTYKQFFLDAGYSDVQIYEAQGRIPCAVAVMTKQEESHEGN